MQIGPEGLKKRHKIGWIKESRYRAGGEYDQTCIKVTQINNKGGMEF